MRLAADRLSIESDRFASENTLETAIAIEPRRRRDSTLLFSCGVYRTMSTMALLDVFIVGFRRLCAC
ncbi:hypothetical protein [Methylosinus sp. LW4]|uniref:hypothetical protein n=1 Tax=Methylosinus sp. LW4 TaxID=136993 RepID=UPI000360443F|nr:hypothetical protein [Methylosinus sp. LW4]